MSPANHADKTSHALRGLWVVTVIGCSAKPSDNGLAIANLKAQADAVGRAVVHEEHEKMAELTHPTLVEKLGGRNKFIQSLETMASEIKIKGFKIRTVELSEPSKIIQASGDLYAIVPFKQELSGPGGAKGTKPSFLIGVSSDRGSNWKFLDGEGIGGDRSKLKLILPGFPDELDLPANQRAIWRRG